MNRTLEIRDRLAREDSNYQRLVRKHQDYEKRLAELREQRFLSDEEQLEEVRLKKLKLALKDHMEELVREACS